MISNLLLNSLFVIPATRDHLRAGDGRAYVAFYGARGGKTFDSWSSSLMAPERAMRLRERIVRRHKRYLEIERERRENALLVKQTGKCVTLTDNNGVEWKL